jgi:hypothetical protein
VQINLPMTVLFVLQEIVDLVPPYLLVDFDCVAVRGNVLDVDPQGFTKSQSSSGAERKKHASLFLGISNNACYYIACNCLGFFTTGRSMNS